MKLIKIILKHLLLNMHTIFLFVGVTFIVIAAFLFNEMAGYLTLGIILVILSKLIDESV